MALNETIPEADMELEAAANEAAGNFLTWSAYISGLTDVPPPEGGYARQEYVPDLDQWTIVYTNRGNQSTCVDDSNSAYIAKALAPFMEGEDPDVVEYGASHCLVGSLDGYRIRVRNSEGKVTEAFKVWNAIAERLEDYPYLDESDHSERVLEQTWKNIEWIGRSFVSSNAPKGWPCDVEYWLSNNGYESEVEDTDDQGGYPDEDVVREALIALGYIDELHGLENGTAAFRRMVKRIRAAKREAYTEKKVLEERAALRRPSWRSRWDEKRDCHRSYEVAPEKLSRRTLNKRARREAEKATKNHFRYAY